MKNRNERLWNYELQKVWNGQDVTMQRIESRGHRRTDLNGFDPTEDVNPQNPESICFVVMKYSFLNLGAPKFSCRNNMYKQISRDELGKYISH